MKRILLRVLFLLGGLIAGLLAGLLLPTEQRLRLSRQVAGLVEGMAERLPDGWPWREVLSGVLQTLERNIDHLARVQVQASAEEAWSLGSRALGLDRAGVLTQRWERHAPFHLPIA